MNSAPVAVFEFKSRDGAAAWKDFGILAEICKNPDRFWGFAYVKPRTEKKVAQTMEAMGIPVFLPLLPKARMHHSTKVVSYLPMLPGYVFLNADDFVRSELRRREKHIVKLELLREPVMEERFIRELQALQCCEELAKEQPVLVRPEIVTGDTVQITGGPLKGLQARVLRREGKDDTIVINLTLLNVHVAHKVSAETLKKITE